MSASNDSSTTPSLSERDTPQISDPEAGDSYTHNATSDTSIPPDRAPESESVSESHDQENQTHTVERSPTGDNDGHVATEMSGQESRQVEATTQQVNGTLEHDVNSNGSDTEYNTENASVLVQTSSSNSQSSEPSTTTHTTVSEQPRWTPHSVQHADRITNTQEDAITLREALDQTTESLGRMSIRDPAPPPSRPDDTSSPTARLSGEAQRPSPGLNPIAPEFTPRPERPPQEFTLPRWQPDSEVTFCPICRTQFSFFVRKHHCRITIPHQYIVRPPGERTLQRYSFLGDEGGIADFTALGGGEQVRLCNPCVPDPNTTPPQTQHSAGQFSPRSTHHRSQSSSSGNYNGDSNLNRPPQYLVLPSPHDAYPRSRSVTVNSGAGPSRSVNASYLPPQSRIFTGTPPAYYPQLVHPRYRRTSLLGHNFPGSSFMDMAGSSSSSSSAAMVNRPLPPAPQIPEEDECPICHRELPSRELPNFEALRESHIESCIIAHSSYNPSPNASGRSSHVTRRTGMFPYLATEKDCVDSAECTICLEEFEVGVPMARLECLCRFHRACITAWFVEHPGRCPVHQHDSLGY
ncbi:hypothetical protein Daesc_010049 [Daldinia eschscholtzii]|uniref:RING-type E3 ubiquitin transferase n=1 Tax=Daldinia eschscholtzii TaxID=292717 RepID=A0AAX6M761_9PEZI